ncbi:MAG TPA: biotin carboxylase N-terminal domain-containing protein [Solirubrobacteraceae bacterium]|nr:biotin carboxylase N-terminal domain-containing protein [Solirubrobacteraceae bacterium]
MFDSVLIANRGEIARRIIRTLDRLGLRSVAIFAPADRDAPHVREADEAFRVSSYLDIAGVLDACRRSGAPALHPGYGFLSENPALARACAHAGVAFVGPPAAASELMADKVRAKEVAAAAGVPVVPGFTEAQARAAAAPYPLLVKAAGGGGGRGMRVVNRPEQLDDALAAARREARAGFGDDRVFIERFLGRARHIEVQVIADAHGRVLHLGERECSLQRRHQKVMEEAPSPVVTPELRAVLGGEAVALARAAGYVNAGTVEFIADFDDHAEHYFLEMNARLQVEHPVTEMVTGLDLVELQLRVAAGERLGLAQEDVRIRGHAIEARINAEDACREFLPAAGRVLAYRRPSGAAVRVDDAIESGSSVDTAYDSLLAKVVVHAGDRPAALARLDHALARTAILGVTTTTGYLRSLLAGDEVRSGEIDTGLIDRLAVPPPPFTHRQVAEVAALMALAGGHERRGDDPFDRVDGWRLGGRRAASWWRLGVGLEQVDVRLDHLGAHELMRTGPDAWVVDVGGDRREWFYAPDGDVVWVGCQGYAWPVQTRSVTSEQDALADGDLRAPMPGQVLLVRAEPGDRVRAGDPVVVLESMKMELVLTAPVDGEVTELSVAVGDTVAVDQPLARVEAVAAG